VPIDSTLNSCLIETSLYFFLHSRSSTAFAYNPTYKFHKVCIMQRHYSGDVENNIEYSAADLFRGLRAKFYQNQW